MNAFKNIPLYEITCTTPDGHRFTVGGFYTLSQSVEKAEEMESDGGTNIVITHLSSFVGYANEDTVLSLEEAQSRLEIEEFIDSKSGSFSRKIARR